jgi:ABC-type sugar transport system ATPase subunit
MRGNGGELAVDVRLQSLEYLGNEVFVRVDAGGVALTARLPAEQLGQLGALRRGDACKVHLNLRAVHLFAAGDGRRLC